MAEPVPNVPLEHCEKITKAVLTVAESMKSQRMVSGQSGHAVLMAIAGDLELLALEIQQDQSGEI